MTIEQQAALLSLTEVAKLQRECGRPVTADEIDRCVAVLRELRGGREVCEVLRAAVGGLRTAPTSDEEWNQQASVVIPWIEGVLASPPAEYIAEKCPTCDGKGYINEEPVHPRRERLINGERD